MPICTFSHGEPQISFCVRTNNDRILLLALRLLSSNEKSVAGMLKYLIFKQEAVLLLYITLYTRHMIHISIALDKRDIQINIISYFFTRTNVVETHRNCLFEYHNMFSWRKILVFWHICR